MQVRHRSVTQKDRKSTFDELSCSIQNCRDELSSGRVCSSGKVSEEQFERCVSKALKDELLCTKPRIESKPNRKHRCTRLLKILWIGFLFFLGFCLFAAGFKPVAFYVHKVS